MAAVVEKDIELTRIELALDNPRHQEPGSQVEVVEWLLSAGVRTSNAPLH